MARRRRKGRRGRKPSRRVKHLYRMFKRKYPHYSKSHIYAMVYGLSPKTLHIAAFKTTPRQYSITHRRAARARRRKSLLRKSVGGLSKRTRRAPRKRQRRRTRRKR